MTDQELRKCDVTRRIVLETLRIHPIAPGIQRTVTNTFEFCGYTVPAGAQVIVGTTVPHHLPEFFSEPERFDVERFTPERAEHSQRECSHPSVSARTGAWAAVSRRLKWP